MAPGGVEPPHADSKPEGRDPDLQGKTARCEAARHCARLSRVAARLEGQSSLSSRARETASGRVATSSLRKMLLTWVLTVLNET